MKSSSLLGHAVELIGLLSGSGNHPADARVGRFFRERRYLGSRDRKIVGGIAYAWLRQGCRARNRMGLWASRSSGGHDDCVSGPITRIPVREALILAELLALARDGLIPLPPGDFLAAAREWIEGRPPRPADAIEDVDDDAHGLGREPPGSRRLLASCLEEPSTFEARLPLDLWPESEEERFATETSLPLWLARALLAERGPIEARALGARLLEEAPVDLRVNLREISREEVRSNLETELGCSVTPTPWSPLGLRLPSRRDIRGTRAARFGWIEVEDEGSQLVVLCTDPQPGQVIIEPCAGAGGKMLAYADLTLTGALERTHHRLVACDIDRGRLEELRRRALNARVASALHIVALERGGSMPPDVPAGDLVLVDAPCSGLGTLRRSPELKRRYGPTRLAEFRAAQTALLREHAGSVKPGGRLAYATCAILREENEEVAEEFERTHAEFEPVVSTWAKAHLPAECFVGPYLRLDPVRTGTDGFFLAQWTRRA